MAQGDDQPLTDSDPDRLPVRWARPIVDGVARLRATIRTKLLGGFLLSALLLLTMGILSIVVINSMNRQVDRIVELQQQMDLARQGIYAVTAQSHYRAMALITQVDSWNDKIGVAKEEFTRDMAAIRETADPEQIEILDRLAAADLRFSDASERVLSLYEQGDLDRATDVHISAEHEISHELEDDLNLMIGQLGQSIETELAAFRGNRQFLTVTVALFSGVSLLTALAMGAVLSWSLTRPVRQIDVALARIADGDFHQIVQVPNRDEFGRLTVNLNRTSTQLAALYDDLSELNNNLEKKIEQQLAQLQRTERLRRYVSPQVADAILTGEAPIQFASVRRNLTILYSDIRGFTQMAERMEPEELIDALNEYFSAGTEIVFSNGGTLDKYLGDGILAFFGDPIPFEDHAERAVASAFEMIKTVDKLRETWMRSAEELSIGIGISTGYVTVGNIGSATRTDYTVVGNHVNVSARLATAAEPGQILVSERTLAAVRDNVEWTPVEDLVMKGVKRPVRVYAVSEKADVRSG
ncbi:MAG TPA: adenylate/guanylate cyclase domain-containing protein [Acidimicrobiia bacterium]|nr:adenylate/guanylate cyclase domain-containing protein [Acidimicrobiia bacterium]